MWYVYQSFSKGKSIVSSKDINNKSLLHSTLFQCNLSSFNALDILYCEDETVVPECSYCVKGNQTNVMANCGGNCQLNHNTTLCERRGK